MPRSIPVLSALFLMVAVTACGPDDDSSSNGSATDSQLVGIYTIDSWTENDTACDVEGPAITTSDTAIVLSYQLLFIFNALTGAPCADLATCRADFTADTLSLAFLFDSGSDADGYTGQVSSAGGGGTECAGAVNLYSLTDLGDQKIRFENREHPMTYTPDASGSCSEGMDAAVEAAKANPCVSFTALTATFAEALPED